MGIIYFILTITNHATREKIRNTYMLRSLCGYNFTASFTVHEKRAYWLRNSHCLPFDIVRSLARSSLCFLKNRNPMLHCLALCLITPCWNVLRSWMCYGNCYLLVIDIDIYRRCMVRFMAGVSEQKSSKMRF